MSTFCRVLLPAPDGPRKPKISPEETEKLMSVIKGCLV